MDMEKAVLDHWEAVQRIITENCPHPDEWGWRESTIIDESKETLEEAKKTLERRTR